MRSRSNSCQALDYYYNMVYRTILQFQVPPTSTSSVIWFDFGLNCIKEYLLAVWRIHITSMRIRNPAFVDADSDLDPAFKLRN
jgi:hypothetical protein